MRGVLAAAVAVVSLSGCASDETSVATDTTATTTAGATPSPSGSTDDSAGEPDPGDGADSPDPSDTREASPRAGPVTAIAAYEVLSADTTGFFEAAHRAEARHPDAVPRTEEEVLDLVDYDFADGVSLVEWDSDGHICFMGPGDTYLAMSERKSDLVRVFGTGACNYDDGDVVLRLVADASFRLTERVVKGGDVARRIPSLERFEENLNRLMTESVED